MTDRPAANDAREREGALDVSRSFIVQAPAGSGKTGLLIQRYLALLARVDRPEAILAMTFTRKAAGEMSERIVEALRKAEAGVAPKDEHEAAILSLAHAALRRDRECGWNLTAHPARLRVQTIDALCAALMRQAPVTTKLGAMAGLIEHAEEVYAAAAREELYAAGAEDAAWRRLLRYLDNDADRVVSLLAGMLAKRDQWLRRLVGQDPTALRAMLEEALAAEIEAELATVRSLFPVRSIGALAQLARRAASNVDGDAAQVLAACATANDLPPATADALPAWCRIAEWLLTGQGSFREQVGVKQGFPAKTDTHGVESADRARNKKAMQTLLAELADETGLAEALHAVRSLPPPRYDDAAWSLVSALLDVLPRAAARLRTVFAREGKMDFAEATLVALDALGAADDPGELLLKLDLRVEHLLVDEFQDTSFAQCDLIERLTSGWTQGDGRTLFAVGDPMQSIYRFREAEVRLFIEAQERKRIGVVAMEPLLLSRNFRSQRGLVDWVNRVFPQVLSPHDDPLRGAVAFRSSDAERDAGEAPAVTLELCANDQEEARLVAGHVRNALERGVESIAVLVRKRSDLNVLLPVLRDAGIAYAAVDIDLLCQRQAVLDLASLTHALIQPDDRLAWLSVLRAPWCGLTLPDLFVAAHAGASFPEIVAGTKSLSGLSADGRARLRRFADTVRPVLAQRGRVPLLAMVRGAWLALGGPACGSEAVDLDAADRFFALVSDHARGSDLPDWEAFQASLDNLYAEPAASAARVQIMTLHRAKGLEFEIVVMPGLARHFREADEELLLWRERPAGLLLAPVRERAPGAGKDKVYRYLRALADDEQQAELKRLIYVGCTRARERLHLTAVAEVDPVDSTRWKRPRAKSSLAALWDAAESQVAPPPTAIIGSAAPAPRRGMLLARLPLAWRLPDPPAALPSGTIAEPSGEREEIVFDWAREAARQIGTIAHALLRRIADDGLEAWSGRRVDAERTRIEHEFAAQGFVAAEALAATDQVLAAVRTTLADTRGRWLFDPRHAEAQSEFAVTSAADEEFVHVVLDRTFVDAEGVRWIVDFKLSRHEGADKEGFLDTERERYRDQLEKYARAMRGMDERPIRLGLYFPLLRGWREWEAPV
ncbi:MAG TPA: UvrD-helicase domain-containing protein [Casimicrobiaceae bacterium]|nr:UvrD-helicase domain-containing protein [Casimicrobiaceae bacterium]